MARAKTLTILVGAIVVGSALAAIASATETITYSYDAKGRLILVQHAGTVNNNVTANYAFDADDNRKNLTVTGAP
ncbi:MAG: hypothetical protein V4610_15830 [Pseudomonadota bacterium]|jgi:hypothetical protein